MMTNIDIEAVGTNADLILNTLEEAAEDIGKLITELGRLGDLPEDVEQFADALRALDVDLHRHVKTLRKRMEVVFVKGDDQRGYSVNHNHDSQKKNRRARLRRMPQAIQDEVLRRVAEKGGDPDEHLAAMMQETVDGLVAAGIVEPAGLNAEGKMVYKSKIYKKPQA